MRPAKRFLEKVKVTGGWMIPTANLLMNIEIPEIRAVKKAKVRAVFLEFMI